MAIQGMWVSGCVAIPDFVGTRGALDGNVQGLVKARFDQSVEPVTARAVGTDIDGSEIVGFRGPGGAAFRGQANKGVLFTFPIPTPPFRSNGTARGTDANRAKLDKVFVLSDSQSGVRINHIWVHDGPNRILLNLPLSGYNGAFSSAITWGNPPATTNVWMLGSPSASGPDVFGGITIAVFVFFTGDENNNQIIFRSAGADFEV